MCITSSMPAPVNCSLVGGVQRVLVAKVSELILSGVGASLTFGTTTTRAQVTAIDAGLDWYELKLDKSRDASAGSENTRAGATAFTHTVLMNVSTDDFDTQRSLRELQNCCGYVALVKHQSGRWYLYGLNFNDADNTYDGADLKVTLNFTTGANVADEAAGHNVTLASPNVNTTQLPVTASAANGVTIVPFAA